LSPACRLVAGMVPLYRAPPTSSKTCASLVEEPRSSLDSSSAFLRTRADRPSS
jgi:hypothetical protein